MEKKLSFNEVLPMEELAPVELDAIVGLAIYVRVVLGNFFMMKRTNAIRQLLMRINVNHKENI